MKNSVVHKIFLVSLVLAVACKEKYTPPVITAANEKFLVVEGYINIGQDSTVITLSHTRDISDTAPPLPEPGASVMVQSDAGGSYALTDEGNGSYYIPYIAGSATAKYRLAITTSAGLQFLSDYVKTKQSPPIDSINWEQQNDGVHIYANSHDDAGNTLYYKWDYIETYEYHAPFESNFDVVNGAIVPRDASNEIFKCWRTLQSTNVYIASTARLSKDVVYKSELVFIPSSTEKLGVLYSILVKQHTLTPEGFNYWQTLRKNTENLGSLFDAQPSQLQGNIHCVNDPSVVTVGFITASTVQQQRIFIPRNQLNNWHYPPDPLSICDTVHLNAQNTANYLATGWIPIDYYTMFLTYAVLPDCADCRRQGGITTKPPFWP
jgi:hypothetical protein